MILSILIISTTEATKVFCFNRTVGILSKLINSDRFPKSLDELVPFNLIYLKITPERA